MNLKIKKFDELTTQELYKLLQLRSAIFVVEQNCVYQDMDDIDQKAVHVFLETEGNIRAYLRFFENEEQEIQIGRVLSETHGKGDGKSVFEAGLKAIESRYSDRTLMLEAQTYAIGFYEQFGFCVCSEPLLEDGIAHFVMKKRSSN